MRWHIGEVENFVALQGIAMGGGCTKGPDVPQKIVDDIAKPYLEKRRPIAEFPLNELQVGWRHQPQTSALEIAMTMSRCPWTTRVLGPLL
jgi:hypothetical protein